MAVLVLADHDLGVLSPATAHVVFAMGGLGPIDVLVLGHDIAATAASAATLAGVRSVLIGDDPAYNEAPTEALVAVLLDLTDNYTHIVTAVGAVGRDVFPRLAARLDIQPVTDIIAIHGPDQFDRPIYAGNAIQTLTSDQPRQVLTVRASAFGAVGRGGSAPIVPITQRPIAAVAKFIAAQRTQRDTPDLATARIVVGGGQSVGSAEGFKLILQLAQRLNAAVGATRAAVDAGYAPNDWQIGQTGKIIAPDLYIAIGVSGALQHLAGIAGAKKIIAINTDGEAPMVKIADFALIGDLFTTIPALIAELDRLGSLARRQ